ncbi:MAG TPA: hypothetical protein VKX17_04200 [Planctomycetota bacterium]|nr:hypothetical protein [Planctomycetota bacterium]
MNNLLKRHGPLLVFIAVLLGCGAWGYLYYTDTAPEVKDLAATQKKIDDTLKKGEVKPEYAESAENRDKIKNAETLKRNVDRIKDAKNDPVGAWVSYPQPTRPKSPEPTAEVAAREIFGFIPPLEKPEAHADHGKIYLSANLPKLDAAVDMEPTRIEIFRGPAADKIDLSKPYATIEINMEEPLPPGFKPPPEPEPKERVRSGTGPAKKPPPPFKLGDLRGFKDVNVEQQMDYFYKMRLVARYTNSDGKLEILTKPDGTKEPVIHKFPKGMTAVAATSPKAKLFATDYTAVVSARTPTNFDVRLAGVNGTVPAAEVPRDPAHHDREDYSVRFEIRVWINELKDWKVAQLNEVKEGQVLSGKVSYKVPGADKPTEYDFTKDLGYKLYEVNMEDVPGPTGSMIKTEVAQLINERTKQIEKFIKSGRPPARKPELDTLDKVIEAQEKDLDKKKRDAEAAAKAAALQPPPPPAPVTPPPAK